MVLLGYCGIWSHQDLNLIDFSVDMWFSDSDFPKALGLIEFLKGSLDSCV
jgi:hypothetical protein